MSAEKSHRTLLRIGGEERAFVVNPASSHGYAILEELRFVRREAQLEAEQAYDDWQVEVHPLAYAVYRAAQDRADAAQDALADWSRQVASAGQALRVAAE